MHPVFDDVRNWLVGPINDRIRGLRVADADLEIEVVERLTRWMWIEGYGLVSVDEETGEVKDAESGNEFVAIGVPYIMLMLCSSSSCPPSARSSTP